MFFRRKFSGRTEYLQIVKNDRVDGRPRQSVVATLGRAEELAQNGTLEDRLIAACHDFEWADIVHDLERLCETEIEQDGKVYLLRNPALGCAGPVPRTLGVLCRLWSATPSRLPRRLCASHKNAAENPGAVVPTPPLCLLTH